MIDAVNTKDATTTDATKGVTTTDAIEVEVLFEMLDDLHSTRQVTAEVMQEVTMQEVMQEVTTQEVTQEVTKATETERDLTSVMTRSTTVS